MDDKAKRTPTNAVNKWGLIGQDIFDRIGKSATSFKFKSRRAVPVGRQGFEELERVVLSNSHSS